MTERKISYAEAIREATDIMMARDPSVFVIGEGVPDPKKIFGTTSGLIEKYKGRVLDMPLSENGMTGICVGAALTGMRPVMVHQRVDFGLLAMDQIANSAAKWNYMFDGKRSVPMVIRFIIGRGWGQGPQHSQSLQALFAHIPGLKVVMPSTPYDAKGMLISAIEDNNPVIFIEHRWLHYIKDDVPEGYYTVPLEKCRVIREGKDITIAATSYMTIESIKASEMLMELGISVEVVDIRTLKPLDEETIISSVKKTKNLLVCDSGWKFGGFAGEVIATVVEKAFDQLSSAPQRIASPDFPTPSSRALADAYYPLSTDIANKVLAMLGRSKQDLEKLEGIAKIRFRGVSLDQPDASFEGPF